MNLSAQELALLFKFYMRSLHFSGGGFYGDSITEHVPLMSDVRASLMLGRLKSLGLVELKGSSDSHRSVFGISDQGEEYISSLLESDPKAVDQAVAFLDTDGSNTTPPSSGEIVDSEDTWLPIPIDRGDVETQQAIDDLASAARALEADNGYAATEPVERAEVVSRLNAGVQFFRSAPALTASAAQAYILWPLQRAAAKFPASTVVGMAVKLAYESLAAWIKKRGGEILDGIFS